MPAILYVETNFVIGIAKGQDPDALRLLSEGVPGLKIVIPAVCVMEAFSTWSIDKKARERFYGEIKKHADEAGRDQSSVLARSLTGSLRQALLDGRELLNAIEDRLYETMERLSENAEILNNIDSQVLFDTFSRGYIDDPTDNLILCAILRHAHSPVPGLKLFVSGNSRDFGTPEPVKALESAGIKYFMAITPALGWLKEERRKARQTADKDENNPSELDRNPEP